MYLSGLGIELLKIQMLARWTSAMITHYARLAPLRSITNGFKRTVLAAEAKGGTIKAKYTKTKTAPVKAHVDKAKIFDIMKRELIKYPRGA